MYILMNNVFFWKHSLNIKDVAIIYYLLIYINFCLIKRPFKIEHNFSTCYSFEVA